MEVSPDHIRALRQRSKMRQKDLAAHVGFSNYQIRKWERGLAHPPESAIKALAKLFGISATKLETAQKNFAAAVSPGEGYTTSKAQYTGIEKATTALPSGRLRVLDLFCGAGGLSFGLELTGRFTTVAGLDLLRDRIATFRINHPHATGIVCDIRELPAQDLANIAKNIDLVVGGPPCQGFSSIRPFRKLTEGDKRNTLIEHFLLSVAAINPRWFVFENVVGVLTHQNGRLLYSLLEGLASCGYTVTWRVMNAAYFGVPQNRERLVIVGNRLGAKFSWPSPSFHHEYKSMAGKRLEVIRIDPLFSSNLPNALTVMDAIGDLPKLASGQAAASYETEPQNEYQRWARLGCEQLSLHEATRHSPRMLEIIGYSRSNISAIPSHLITSGFSTCYSRLDADSPSTTLTVNFVHPASNRCIHPHQDRALTPREGARIQSFPDSFVFSGTRAQTVKQIGNAVPPLLARALGNSIASADKQAMLDCAESPSRLDESLAA